MPSIWQNSLTDSEKKDKLIFNTRVHQNKSDMHQKQKVTLYIPPGLHRQLKIRAAVDSESMSGLVERAIAFYLEHPEQVEEAEANLGKTHQVHICPECQAAMVNRDGQMVSLKNQPSVLDDQELPEELPLEAREEAREKAREKVSNKTDSPDTQNSSNQGDTQGDTQNSSNQGEEQLVPC